MRLIDADKYLEKVCTYKETGCGSCRLQTVCPKDAPTVDVIPTQWLKNKREELEKEYHDSFHDYTDEGRLNQVRLLNDFHAFDTVLGYWEKENG